VFGHGYREGLERGIPGAVEQAVADADAFFAAELPALQAWEFGEAEGRRVTHPVLAVVGERTAATFPPRTALLCSWLPNVERFELPGASHLLHLENARLRRRSRRSAAATRA
jgi:pimeloyl-ACP methyl ester carboxylesterase